MKGSYDSGKTQVQVIIGGNVKRFAKKKKTLKD